MINRKQYQCSFITRGYRFHLRFSSLNSIFHASSHTCSYAPYNTACIKIIYDLKSTLKFPWEEKLAWCTWMAITVAIYGCVSYYIFLIGILPHSYNSNRKELCILTYKLLITEHLCIKFKYIVPMLQKDLMSISHVVAPNTTSHWNNTPVKEPTCPLNFSIKLIFPHLNFLTCLRWDSDDYSEIASIHAKYNEYIYSFK